jgi:hypothetical protein
VVFTGVRYGANVRCGEYGAFRLQQQTTTSSRDRPLVRRPPSGLGRVGIGQDSGRVLTRTLGEYFSGGDPVSSSLSD